MPEPTFTGLTGLYPSVMTQVTDPSTSRGPSTGKSTSTPSKMESISGTKARSRNIALYGIRKNIERLKAEGLSHEQAVSRVQQNLMASGDYSPQEALMMIHEATLSPLNTGLATGAPPMGPPAISAGAGPAPGLVPSATIPPLPAAPTGQYTPMPITPKTTPAKGGAPASSTQSTGEGSPALSMVLGMTPTPLKSKNPKLSIPQISIGFGGQMP